MLHVKIACEVEKSKRVCNEEGEDVGWSNERWRDESVPSVRCVPVAGCSCVLHNTAARSNLHAEDSSLEVLNFVNDAVEGVNQKKK